MISVCLMPRSLRAVLVVLLAMFAIVAVCPPESWGTSPASSKTPKHVITIWHPMRPTKERDVLYEEFNRFKRLNPTYEIHALYKEVEELRSAFQAAALAGEGPDLVYGPSDVLDTFH